MAGDYLKPQTPLMYEGDYIYPLTVADQVIGPDGERLAKDGRYNLPVPDGAVPKARTINGLSLERDIVLTNQLLHNWYLPAPHVINQRGVSGQVSTPGYFIDRWKLISGTVELTESGLLLNGVIAQILEDDPGEDVTASALTTEGVIQARYDRDSKTFSITGTGETIIAAKLELGDRQTLAHQDESGKWMLIDPPPEKVLELLRCQRYFYAIHAPGIVRVAAGRCMSATQIVYPLHTAVPMRTTPTIIHSDLTLFTNSTANSTLTTTGISLNNTFSNVLDLVVVVPETAAGNVSLLRLLKGAYIYFSAEL